MQAAGLSGLTAGDRTASDFRLNGLKSVHLTRTPCVHPIPLMLSIDEDLAALESLAAATFTGHHLHRSVQRRSVRRWGRRPVSSAAKIYVGSTGLFIIYAELLTRLVA